MATLKKQHLKQQRRLRRFSALAAILNCPPGKVKKLLNQFGKVRSRCAAFAHTILAA
jgi:hypothetical protein